MLGFWSAAAALLLAMASPRGADPDASQLGANRLSSPAGVPSAAPSVSPSPAAPKKGVAPQAESATVELSIIWATRGGKGLDPRLGNLPELAKPPFSAYDSYELLSREEFTLARRQPKFAPLPNGRVMELELLERAAGQVRIAARVNHPNGKDYLPLLEVRAHKGQHFIVAGQAHRGGILVLVLTVSS